MKSPLTDEEYCAKMMAGFAEDYARGTLDWETFQRLRDGLFEHFGENVETDE